LRFADDHRHSRSRRRRVAARFISVIGFNHHANAASPEASRLSRYFHKRGFEPSPTPTFHWHTTIGTCARWRRLDGAPVNNITDQWWPLRRHRDQVTPSASAALRI
jgi:hypothetical protein